MDSYSKFDLKGSVRFELGLLLEHLAQAGLTSRVHVTISDEA